MTSYHKPNDIQNEKLPLPAKNPYKVPTLYVIGSIGELTLGADATVDQGDQANASGV